MKKIKLVVISCLVALVFSSCVLENPNNGTGIIEKVTCTYSSAVFYEPKENKNYSEVTFRITLNDDTYIGEIIEIAAEDKDSKEIYRADFTVTDSLTIYLTYFEPRSLSIKDLNNRVTKQLIIYHEGSVVGTVDVSSINIVSVI